jgi:hypothetical protein
MNTMKAFWNDCGQGQSPDSPVDIDLVRAQNIWSDGRGVKGNFFGLVDKQGRTVQFYFTDGIPDDVDDARHLEIVLLDFPVPEKKGAYSRQVSIGEVHGLIQLAFSVGADHSAFSGVKFFTW